MPSSHSYSAHPDAAPPSVDDLAADWLARREFGFSVEAQAEFSRWLLADAQHAEAVQRLEQTWRRLCTPRLSHQAGRVLAAVEQEVAQRARMRRRWFAGLSLGSLAAAAALVFLLEPVALIPRLSPAASLPGSVAVKPERQVLADGSLVELNLGAEIAVTFTPEQRVVHLVRGEAHFSVAKNAARPFLVIAGDVTVRAVGTAFDVNLHPEHVGVFVTEGRVAVGKVAEAKRVNALSEQRSSSVYLDAGGQIRIPSDSTHSDAWQPTMLSAAEMEAAQAWRSLRVEFTDTPLSEVVTLFNRKNALQLGLGEPSLGDLRISGVFWANAPEAFSRLLEASAGTRAERVSATRIVLQHN